MNHSEHDQGVYKPISGAFERTADESRSTVSRRLSQSERLREAHRTVSPVIRPTRQETSR